MFLEHPPTSESVDVAFADDLQSEGYVMNLTRLWSWRPDVADEFGDVRDVLLGHCELTDADVAPVEVREAVTFGRPPQTIPS